MRAPIAKPLTGENNKRLNNKEPIHSEATAAILNIKEQLPHSRVALPGEDEVVEAKDWVDNGSRL